MDTILAKVAPYHKLIGAIAGVVLWITLKRLGIDLPGLEGLVLDLLSGALIVGGAVYQAPANKPPKAEDPDQ